MQLNFLCSFLKMRIYQQDQRFIQILCVYDYFQFVIINQYYEGILENNLNLIQDYFHLRRIILFDFFFLFYFSITNEKIKCLGYKQRLYSAFECFTQDKLKKKAKIIIQKNKKCSLIVISPWILSFITKIPRLIQRFSMHNQ